MPTYVYKCSNCKHEFEAQESIKAGNVQRCCPYCNWTETFVKVIQPASLSFKGNGFYETDYKKKR